MLKEKIMDEIIEVENYVDAHGTRFLHLMSNSEISVGDLEPPWIVPADVNAKLTREAGAFHLRAEWLAREAFAGLMRGSDRRERQMVLWAMKKGDRISTSVVDAAVEFRKAFARNPSYAAVRVFPTGVEDDCEIEIGGGRLVALVECADVPERFVMVF